MNIVDPLILDNSKTDQEFPPGHSPYSQSRPRKHGYVTELALAANESDAFYSLERCLYDEYRPTCATESLLLDEVTLNYWRLQRARALEAETLADDRGNGKLLALYSRYRAAFERSFFRALQFLRKVKAENSKWIAQYRAKLTPLRPSAQFVSQNSSHRPSGEAQTYGPPDLDEAA